MRTKLIIAAVATALAIALIGSAFASGPGCGKGMGYGPGNCPMSAGAAPAGLTPEQTAKYQAFQKDTVAQREKMAQLRQEMWQLKNQPTPNWDAVNAKHQEFFTLKTELAKKAQAAGIERFGYGRDGRGMGKGMGMGCCRGGCF